jgi:bacillithiol biosynthesis deacetylase BshB1
VTASEFDLIAIGAHPDDVEIACGGLLAKLARRGYRIAIFDLTRGELGTNGDVDTRAREAEAAADVLGVASRLQLGLPDAGLDGRDAAQLHSLVMALRRHAPRVVVAPHPHSRHPDHIEAAALAARARFFAAVPRFAPQVPAVPRPSLLWAPDYWPVAPSFVVDIGPVLDVKLAALQCYRSQFERHAGSRATHLNDAVFLRRVTSDAHHYGRLAGVEAAEGFVVEGAVLVDDPVALQPRPAEGNA